MTMLDDLPAGPQLRPERADADKAVIGDAVRAAKSTAPAHLPRHWDLGSVLKWRAVSRRGAVVSALVAAALALVVVLVVPPALRTPGGAHSPMAGHGGRPGRSSAWRLVSDVSPSWRTLPNSDDVPEGLPAMNLICPTTTTCFAANWEPTGPGTASEFVVTHDAGNTWQPSVLPVALSRPPSLACVDADTCAIFGVDGSGRPAFLTTSDGGQTWSSHAGPNGLASVDGPTQLACTSATSCLVVAADGSSAGASVVMTDDSGNTWSSSTLPMGFMPSALQCMSAENCVLRGFSPYRTPATTGGAILYTTDGGSSWTAAVIPSGLSGFGRLSSL
jgi:hypothetical protein